MFQFGNLTMLFVLIVAGCNLLFVSSADSLENGAVLSEKMGEPYLGDLDGMRERGFIRMLVPYSQTSFYIDKGRMRGVTAELAHEFEIFLNKHLGLKRSESIKVVMIPTERDAIIPAIVQGRGDIAAANLTITDDRSELVDFANPLMKDVRELVVTGKEVADFSSFRDLPGIEIHVRKSSSYFESLTELNQTGLSDAPLNIVEADETLEDEELLEMVNAGLIPAIVVDSHKLEFWRRVFPNIKVHDELPVREGGEIAWALRKNSPELMDLVNSYVKIAAKGTLIGNTIYRRYFDSEKWLKNIKAPEYAERLINLQSLFRKYGREYRINWIIIAALAFQESKFDQSARSRAGAVGIMQIKPSTAQDPNVGIADVSSLENNIHAGVKYLRFIADQYFGGEDVDDTDRIFMALASYNAGPNGIARVREQSDNPDRWFGALEHDVAGSIGMEPVHYVSNIFCYYQTLKGVSQKARTAEKIEVGHE